MTTNSILKVISVFVFLITTISVSGQTVQYGTLKGKVIDKATKQSLPGATIAIKGTQSGTSADANGEFNLQNVKEGIYSLTVSFVGYQKKTINDVQVIRNKTNYIEIEVEEAVVALKDITVNAQRFENSRIT